MIAELKTVARLIDATATEDRGKAIAIRYVTESGEIREMLVSKPMKPGHKTQVVNTTQRRVVAPRIKEQALIQVHDHTDMGQYKSLFLFSIIAFNPEGNLSGPWHTIKRG